MQTQQIQGLLRQDPVATLEPTKYCLYARKSTEQEEKQVLSIDSQIKEMLQMAQRDNLNIVEIRKESHSAKDSGQRPVFNQLLIDIREKKFNGILTWAPDRLSRNAGDLGSLVDLMDQKLLREIKTFSQQFSNNPNEKFLLMILCSQAKLENDNKSMNVKRGLRTRVEMGLWPGQAPTGYLNENRMDRKGHLLVDSRRAPVIKKMFEKVAYERYSGRMLYSWLKDEINFRTKSDKHLTLSNVYRILKNTMYYGVHEYPEGSGSWYTGKYTPIITPELFEKVQDRINKEGNAYGTKEFAFTKLITCGLCESGITAQEKFKKLKDGTTARYVYYGCTRSRSIACKNGYLNEGVLIDQLLNIIDDLDVNEIGIKHKLEQEIARFDKFKYGVLGIRKDAKLKSMDVDVKTYAKYILKEGTVIEKRELMGCLKSKFLMKDRKLLIENQVA